MNISKLVAGILLSTMYLLGGTILLLMVTASPPPPPVEDPVVIVPEKLKPILAPELVPICSCESSYSGTKNDVPQQFEKDGKTVRYGRVEPDDRGMCQINRRIHAEAIKKMEVDIETEEGNITFANYLFETQGKKPWNWSKHCWQ